MQSEIEKKWLCDTGSNISPLDLGIHFEKERQTE
jgi:hypothetical protein